jgi:hypothetical protein
VQRRDEVDHAGPANRRALVLEHHQQERRDRHPSHAMRKGTGRAGGDDQGQGRHQQRDQQMRGADRAVAALGREVDQSVEPAARQHRGSPAGTRPRAGRA